MADRRRIKLLPDQLINRIAAGEAVERPSSVLKELLENSLDAGADRIEIEISGGGKKLISVRDNGCGMDEDDLLMCLERHATSKIGSDADLMNIATLGFRGEALPSIGAVSQLTIVSAAEGGEGRQVRMSGGRLLGLSPAPANRGSAVEVRNLFYNVPARREFLKSERTESAHLLDVAQSYALGREGLRLIFRENGREMLAVEALHDFRTRIFKVLGRDAAEGLTPLAFERGGLKISGWLGSPDRLFPNSSRLFVYVLGRPVRDRLLNRALIDGYGRLLPKGSWPAGALFLELDPAAVDVNVHPTKAEVRFRRPSEVFAALAAAVAEAAGRAPVRASPPPNSWNSRDWARVAKVSPFKSYDGPPENDDFRPAPFSPRPEAATPRSGSPEADSDEERPSPPWLTQASPEAPPDQASPDHAPPDQVSPEQASPEAPPDQASFLPRRRGEPNFEPLRPLAQLYNSYILAEGAQGLYLIDQHAAHERLLFNKLKRDLARDGLPGQTLLLPLTLELSPQEALAATELNPQLARLGYDLEVFGERGGFLLRGVPAILAGQDPRPPLMEILAAGSGHAGGQRAAGRRAGHSGGSEQADGAGLNEALAALADSWLYSLACRAALKAGGKMSLEAMTRLLEDMAREPNGAYCPHGRPAIQLIERSVIERRFYRFGNRV